MSDESLDEQSRNLVEGRGRKSGGASIEGFDPRVSRAVNWVLAGVGTALVSVGLWIGTNIYQLNLTVARVVDKTDALLARLDKNDTRDDRQDQEIGNLNQHVYVLEGKALRGVPFDQEARRERH